MMRGRKGMLSSTNMVMQHGNNRVQESGSAQLKKREKAPTSSYERNPDGIL